MLDLSRRNFIAATSASVALAAVAPEVIAAPAPAPIGYRHTTFHNFKDGFTVEGLERYIAGMKRVVDNPYIAGCVVLRNIRPRSAEFPYDWLMSMDNRSLDDRKEFYKSPVLKDFVYNIWMGTYSSRVIIDICQPIARAVSDGKGVGFRRVQAFTFKDGVAQAERDGIRAELDAVLRDPAVLNSVSGPSYLPKNADMPLDWLLTIDFADQSIGEAFLKSHAYETLQKKLDKLTENQIAFESKDIRNVSTVWL